MNRRGIREEHQRKRVWVNTDDCPSGFESTRFLLGSYSKTPFSLQQGASALRLISTVFIVSTVPAYSFYTK